MIRFEHPMFLWLLAAVPIFIVAGWLALWMRRRDSQKFVSAPLIERIAYAISPGRLGLKAALWIGAWTSMAVGVAGPQVGTKLEEVKRKGIDVIVALDVSNSMLSADIRPSRLESSKNELVRFVSGLKGDRVGLIAFAGSALNHCPLTTDYGAVKMLTRVIDNQMIEDQGTVITDAINMAVKSFGDEQGASRVLIIISDGEDQEEEAIEAAKDATEKGIRIYTIGMGTPQGAPIPVFDKNGRDAGFKRDPSGNVIVTRLNEGLLQSVAESGKGQYLRGTQSAKELETIWDDIGRMEQRELGTKQYSGYENRFQYFVLAALLLLLGEFVVSERKSAYRESLLISILFKRSGQRSS